MEKTVLSKREVEIVRLAASGLSNCAVGQRLSLSESTVKNYLVRVYEKLGISTRIELILYILSYDQSNESEENDRGTKLERRSRVCVWPDLADSYRREQQETWSDR